MLVVQGSKILRIKGVYLRASLTILEKGNKWLIGLGLLVRAGLEDLYSKSLLVLFYLTLANCLSYLIKYHMSQCEKFIYSQNNKSFE